jgi:hypothetical protein
MPADPLKLTALTLSAIEKAGGDFDAIRQAVAAGHAAAVWAGVAERSTGPRQFAIARLRELAGERALPRADRERLRARLQSELGYLARFAREAEGMSPAAFAARAALYAGAVRGTYYEARWGDWEIPDTLLPGNNACLGNCRCTASITRDNGDGTGVWTRILGGERHCDDCPPLAGDHPVRRRGNA